MDAEFIKIIACPSCKGSLQHDVARRRLVCRVENLYYDIREDGIPILLTDEAKFFKENDKDKQDNFD